MICWHTIVKGHTIEAWRDTVGPLWIFCSCGKVWRRG